MNKKTKRKTSGWCLITIPGYFIALAGGAMDSGPITLAGLVVCVVGAVIWAITYNPNETIRPARRVARPVKQGGIR